jgi:hypothetical protein
MTPCRLCGRPQCDVPAAWYRWANSLLAGLFTYDHQLRHRKAVKECLIAVRDR